MSSSPTVKSQNKIKSPWSKENFSERVPKKRIGIMMASTKLRHQAAHLNLRAMWLMLLFFLPSTLTAQRQVYVGALGGLATLSGDGRYVVTSTSTATSLYDPGTGGA